MTLTLRPRINSSSSKQSPENIRNVKTAQALKRYLDLTLTGTKKNLAVPGKHGRKGHPPSPYTFDKPNIENIVHLALRHDPLQTGNLGYRELHTAPGWVQNINEKICKHSGEAPMFTENFLPSNKSEQTKRGDPRPLSGISTKSAPVLINGEMYYRPNRKHSYLQASNRPSSAKEDRLTRAAKLRNKHRSQAMSSAPSSDTRIQLKRMKEVKPKPLHLNNDLLPIPCHTGETPHSFIVGARYNCSHFLDSRSYARLGLYLPRQNPLHAFLKVYKGEDGITEMGSDSDFVGYTSVRVGDGSGSGKMQAENGFYRNNQTKNRSIPAPHMRKVIREAWLSEEKANPTCKPPSSSMRSSKASNKNQEYKAPSTTPTQEKPRSESKRSRKANMNIKGRPAPTSGDVEGRITSSTTRRSSLRQAETD